MQQYTLISIAGLIVVLLGGLAFLGGVGEWQAKQRFTSDVADDRHRFEQKNATKGYNICQYNNATGNLTCPDNPYTDSPGWIIGGLATVAIGLGGIYYDIELR